MGEEGKSWVFVSSEDEGRVPAGKIFIFFCFPTHNVLFLIYFQGTFLGFGFSPPPHVLYMYPGKYVSPLADPNPSHDHVRIYTTLSPSTLFTGIPPKGDPPLIGRSGWAPRVLGLPCHTHRGRKHSLLNRRGYLFHSSIYKCACPKRAA